MYWFDWKGSGSLTLRQKTEFIKAKKYPLLIIDKNFTQLSQFSVSLTSSQQVFTFIYLYLKIFLMSTMETLEEGVIYVQG